ncbi:MAG: PilW family protein, partial [Rubrivivax sp.]|nr:PilW family protein [Rubrivivax sp.]
LRTIVALRVSLLLRSSVPERAPVGPQSLQMFAALPAAVRPPVRSFTSDERLLRWRLAEFTVPLRNVMLAPTP